MSGVYIVYESFFLGLYVLGADIFKEQKSHENCRWRIQCLKITFAYLCG